MQVEVPTVACGLSAGCAASSNAAAGVPSASLPSATHSNETMQIQDEVSGSCRTWLPYPPALTAAAEKKRWWQGRARSPWALSLLHDCSLDPSCTNTMYSLLACKPSLVHLQLLQTEVLAAACRWQS